MVERLTGDPTGELEDLQRLLTAGLEDPVGDESDLPLRRLEAIDDGWDGSILDNVPAVAEVLVIEEVLDGTDGNGCHLLRFHIQIIPRLDQVCTITGTVLPRG